MLSFFRFLIKLNIIKKYMINGENLYSEKNIGQIAFSTLYLQQNNPLHICTQDRNIIFYLTEIP